MRRAAIIVGVLALIALLGGTFAFWLGGAYLCFDVCPSVGSAGTQLASIAAITLAPGLILSLIAWILSLLLARAGGRSAAFIVTLLTPIAVIIAGAAILYFAGGGFTPVATAGETSLAPADRQVSAEWLSAASYAVGPLIVWPLVSFITALLSAPNPRG